jgi:hypothetical protein
MNTMVPSDLDCDLGSKERSPLFLAPSAGDFIGDQSIPQDSRGDVDAILPREFDC